MLIITRAGQKDWIGFCRPDFWRNFTSSGRWIKWVFTILVILYEVWLRLLQCV